MRDVFGEPGDSRTAPLATLTGLARAYGDRIEPNQRHGVEIPGVLFLSALADFAFHRAVQAYRDRI